MAFIRDNIRRPLRAVIRAKLAAGDLGEADLIRVRRLNLTPALFDRLCSQIEVKAAELHQAGKLEGFEFVRDERSRGWREYFDFIIDNWQVILQLLAIIIPLIAADREES